MNHPIQSGGVVRVTYPSGALHMCNGILTSLNGEDEEVAEERCSRVNSDGSTSSGRCKSVCKGREVKKDYGNKYGWDYYCTATKFPAEFLIAPIFRLIS
jgi:hypothetical protein